MVQSDSGIGGWWLIQQILRTDCTKGSECERLQPLARPEGYCYTVECEECVAPGGAPLWLGDFSAEELEAVPA